MLIYGKGVHALAGDMKDGTPEKAQEFMDAYFKEFPKVKEWLDNTKAKVQTDKYVENMLGRHRRLAGIDSTNQGVRANCMRQSVNAPIQSTGSDIMLISMIVINKKFKALKLKSKMAITVHDSLVIDTYLPELPIVWEIVQDTMEHPERIKGFEFTSVVPLKADAEIGRSYGALVEIDSLDEIKEYGGDVFKYIDAKMEEKYQKDLEIEAKARG